MTPISPLDICATHGCEEVTSRVYCLAHRKSEMMCMVSCCDYHRLIGLPLIGNYDIPSKLQRFQDQMKSALEGLSPSERLIAIQEVSADYCIQIFGCGDDITERNCESCINDR